MCTCYAAQLSTEGFLVFAHEDFTQKQSKVFFYSDMHNKFYGNEFSV